MASLFKITPSVFLLFLLLNCTATAQQILNFKHSCSFDGDQEDAEIYADDASDEAAVIVRNIMKMNVLPQNFVLKSGNVKNALASVQGKQRFILYSTTFLENFKAGENAKWAAYCLMAHEIGHHLSNHDMEETDPAKCRLREIQADKFAGGVLFRMGATLSQAQSGINNYTQDSGSKTHPPKFARLEAVASGWKQMQENMKQSGFELPKVNVQNPFKPVLQKQPAPTPTFTEVSDNLTARKLVGTWEIMDEGNKEKSTVIFFSNGKYSASSGGEKSEGTWSIKAGIFIGVETSLGNGSKEEDKHIIKFIDSDTCEMTDVDDKTSKSTLKRKR